MDDDDPAVRVSFGSATYTVPEGGTRSVTVNLSADPERTVTIPDRDESPADWLYRRLYGSYDRDVRKG